MLRLLFLVACSPKQGASPTPSEPTVPAGGECVVWPAIEQQDSCLTLGILRLGPTSNAEELVSRVEDLFNRDVGSVAFPVRGVACQEGSVAVVPLRNPSCLTPQLPLRGAARREPIVVLSWTTDQFAVGSLDIFELLAMMPLKSIHVQMGSLVSHVCSAASLPSTSTVLALQPHPQVAASSVVVALAEARSCGWKEIILSSGPQP